MGRKKNPASEMDVAEKMSTPLAQQLSELITDANALKDYLGVSAQAINQYKLGISRPSLENLCKIADFYKVSVDYLLGRTKTKSPDATLQAVCKYTGLSEESVKSIEFDHSQERRKGAFEIMDFLISEFYLGFWANEMWNFVKNSAEVQGLQHKLGADIVADHTRFYKWRATRAFEEAYDKAIERFSAQYVLSPIIDKKAYLAKRKKEYTDMLARIQAAEEQEEKENGKHHKNS